MKRVRIGSLCDILLGAQTPIQVDREPVRRVVRVASDGCDLVLTGSDKQVLAKFDDQRVRLDVDQGQLEATDLCGRRRLVTFDMPVAA